MENKRVAAIAAVMALAFIGICYKGYESYSQFKDSQAQINQNNSKIENYQSDDFLPPTPANRKLVESAAAEVEQLSSALKKDFGKYVSYCMQGSSAGDDDMLAYKPNVNPVAFQNRLKALSADIAAKAANRKIAGQVEPCKLNNGAADFGMTSLKNQAPKEVDAPYLNFLLSAVNRAERHIIAAGAPSIERVYCAPLPEDEIGARKKPDFFPLSFEIAFTALRSEVVDASKADSFSVLPQVINKLVQDENFFFIITGMAVSTPGNLPVLDAAAAPAPAPAEDGQAVAADEGKKAVLITGKQDEKVNVHINVQVLYFTTDKF